MQSLYTHLTNPVRPSSYAINLTTTLCLYKITGQSELEVSPKTKKPSPTTMQTRKRGEFYHDSWGFSRDPQNCTTYYSWTEGVFNIWDICLFFQSLMYNVLNSLQHLLLSAVFSKWFLCLITGAVKLPASDSSALSKRKSPKKFAQPAQATSEYPVLLSS